MKRLKNMFSIVRSGRVRRVGGGRGLTKTRVNNVGVRTTVSIVFHHGRVRGYAHNL